MSRSFEMLSSAVWLVIMCSTPDAEAADCQPVDHDSSAYRMLLERSAGLFPHRPADVLDCGDVAYSHLWRVRWDVYQTLGPWRKRGTAACWAFYSEGHVEMPYCSRKIHVAHTDGTELVMDNEIALDRVAEIVQHVRATIPEDDRVLEIQYTEVRGGGSWSLTRHGYRVSTSSAPHHGSGVVYTVVTDCTPTPCVWQVTKAGRWVY